VIAFFQTGGIGDAILGSAIIDRLIELYGRVALLHYNHLVPQVIQGREDLAFIRKMTPEMCCDMDAVRKYAPEVDMVVFNKFRKDHDGKLNFFCPTNDSMNREAASYRNSYDRAFEAEYGKPFSELDPLVLLDTFNSETDYFSDWKRYGMNVGYDDVNIPIHDYTVDRNESKVLPIGKFAIVHDSKMPIDGKSVYPLKAWYRDRWKNLCHRIRDDYGLAVVQIITGDQEPFCDSVIPHYDIIGKDAIFQDYLYMLSKSALYVGTDSWPAHAAIFARGPKYVFLKGAVSRRWDHDYRFSKIIRMGSCQACEGPLSASNNCVWDFGNRGCMNVISVDNVMEAISSAIG